MIMYIKKIYAAKYEAMKWKSEFKYNTDNKNKSNNINQFELQVKLTVKIDKKIK